MRSSLILFCLFIGMLFTSLETSAQKASSQNSDSLAKELIERYKKVNSAKMSMPGFRVQIYFGSERNKAQELKNDFAGSFPQSSSYLLYHQPYFKVRVGDFRTRLEAQGFLKKLGDRYTTAFIVPDEVKLPDQ